MHTALTIAIDLIHEDLPNKGNILWIKFDEQKILGKEIYIYSKKA